MDADAEFQKQIIAVMVVSIMAMETTVTDGITTVLIIHTTIIFTDDDMEQQATSTAQKTQSMVDITTTSVFQISIPDLTTSLLSNYSINNID